MDRYYDLEDYSSTALETIELSYHFSFDELRVWVTYHLSTHPFVRNSSSSSSRISEPSFHLRVSLSVFVYDRCGRQRQRQRMRYFRSKPLQTGASCIVEGRRRHLLFFRGSIQNTTLRSRVCCTERPRSRSPTDRQLRSPREGRQQTV